PLRGPDGNTYAVAQGAVSVGGFSAEANGTSISKNHTTVGLIPDGAIIEREIPFDFNSQQQFSIALHTGDFSTVSQAAARINAEMGPGVATAVDARTIRINVPDQYRTHLVGLMARIENMEIVPDTAARVVLNERTGTVVIGANVRISTVAVSHGNLHIKIQTSTDVSQPNAFGGGQTVVTQQSAVQAAEQDKKLFVVESGATIGDLVRALNAVGVTPRDLVSILQSIKAAGALQAQLEII
ncbi:flagellar basal body P-ring protein FlgI, partial [bacterium]|nr:flagellar basal body P-ring protein FlgI [bacterium]